MRKGIEFGSQGFDFLSRRDAFGHQGIGDVLRCEAVDELRLTGIEYRLDDLMRNVRESPAPRNSFLSLSPICGSPPLLPTTWR